MRCSVAHETGRTFRYSQGGSREETGNGDARSISHPGSHQGGAIRHALDWDWLDSAEPDGLVHDIDAEERSLFTLVSMAGLTKQLANLIAGAALDFARQRVKTHKRRVFSHSHLRGRPCAALKPRLSSIYAQGSLLFAGLPPMPPQNIAR